MNKIFSPFELHCAGRLLRYERPAVMGILNVTPDSFYDGGCYDTDSKIVEHAEMMLREGADIIDVGVVSTRPGAQLMEPDKEAEKLSAVVRLLRKELPDAVLSVDTCFSLPAAKALDAGANIINDISGGMFDSEMFSTVARYHVPYILMHNTATPDRMQLAPHYENILQEVSLYFSRRLEQLYQLGVSDVLLDPGFGFGKTLEHNYMLFRQLPQLIELFPRQPLLVALSRKSMIYKPLGISPQEALPGTIALDAQAMQMGARLVRVHDVKEAVQTARLFML